MKVLSGGSSVHEPGCTGDSWLGQGDRAEGKVCVSKTRQEEGQVEALMRASGLPRFSQLLFPVSR